MKTTFRLCFVVSCCSFLESCSTIDDVLHDYPIIIVLIPVIIGAIIIEYISDKRKEKKYERYELIKRRYPNAFKNYCLKFGYYKFDVSCDSFHLNEAQIEKVLSEDPESWKNQESAFRIREKYGYGYYEWKSKHNLTFDNELSLLASDQFDDFISSYAKKIVEDEKEIKTLHFKEVDSIFNTNVLSAKDHPLRKKYVCLYIGVATTPEKLDSNQKENVINHIDDLDKFIKEHYKEEYERIKSLYPDGVEYFSTQNDDEDFGEHLKGNEFYKACIDSEESIKKQQEICNNYAQLLKKYPNGIKGYEDSHIKFDDNLCRSWKPGKEEIVQLGEERLAALEQRSKSVELGKEWIAKQKSLANTLRENCKTYIPNWGCYFYDLSVETPSYYEHPQINNFRIWQFFYSSYCDDTTLDYTLTPSQKNESLKNSKFISRKISYKDVVYDAIIPFIRFIKDQSKNVCVVFGNSELDSYEKLNMQFAYLSTLLTIGEDISCFDSIREIDITDDTCVIVFELITSNDNLRKQCYEIINSHKDKHPTICYISLRKGYDTKEMSDLIAAAKEKKKIEEEKAEKIAKAKSIAKNYGEAFEQFFSNVNIYEITISEAEEIISAEDKLRLYRDRYSRARKAVSDWESVKNIPYYYFYHYYPTRFDDITIESRNVRNLIYHFKDGQGMSFSVVSDMMEKKLKSTFSKDDLSQFTLVCIPASTIQDNEDRYLKFSNKLCSDTGMRNGFTHITITKEKDPSHLGGTDSAEYSYDGDFFKGAMVILFDDVVTRGRSMGQMKSALESLGATVICAMSIGRTYSDYYGDNRTPHPWTGNY